MPTCHACNAEVDAKSLALGRCGKCGAALRKVPQRNIQDIRDTLEQDLAGATDAADQADDANVSELDTLDPSQHDDTTPDVNPDTIQTMELPTQSSAADPPSPPSSKPGTVAFAGEQTIDFTDTKFGDGSINIDVTDSMVTAQWLDNVAGGENDPDVTIKQKETIHGEMQTRSSLVVKSRQVRSPNETDIPVTSAADAPDYELLDVIGEGGMGVVYAARQSAIARTVAVKMLKGTDEHTLEQREKFISEAVVTGELDHPNIVPIYDLGSNDSGALFYSMKRVRGTPWDDVFQQNTLEDNLNILLRVADAIAFAHANGVLHRDLKPENVMLGDFGEVLVMDWGLARISAEFPNADAVSQSDVMGGTPAYMAPEMATGPVDQITTASDIYLLGAILFEIVTGKPPHSGKTVMACLFAAAKNKFVETEASGELMDIAMRAMATKTDQRYATVQEFQAAVRQYQSHSESVLLTDSASKNLQAAIDADDYDLYSRAVYGFEEAVAMWSGNSRAQALLTAARGAYAQSALERSDFDLGISLLDENEQEHADLLAKLVAGRDERESRNRRLTLMKRAVAALLVAVVGIVSASYFAVRAQRNEAIAQRDRADENYQKAEAAREAEETQRKVAVEQRKKAQEQEQIATKNAAEAQRQKRLAIDAKQAEEYEAYVARIGLANAKIEENAFDRAFELLEQCNPMLRHWEWGRLSHLCRLSKRTWRVDGPVEAVAISADGRYYLSGDWDGKAKLWDAESGGALHTVTHGEYVHAVAFDPSGGRFATASSDGTVQLHSIESGELQQTIAGHEDAVVSVRFSNDGKQLLTAGFDNNAKLWDAETGELTQTLSGHSWWVWAAEFSPDNERIVTISQDGTAIVWARKDGRYQWLTEFAKHKGPIYAAQFSPDGQSVATAGYDRRVLMWSPETAQPIDIGRRLNRETDPPAPFVELAQHDGPIRTLAFSPDGQQLVSGGQDNVLRVWDFRSGVESEVIRGHASHVRDCAFSPDGKKLLSGGRDQLIKLWQPSAYGEALVLGAGKAGTQGDAVLAARFSRDGQRIVTASRDRTATLWDAQRRTPLQVFAEGHDFLASSAIFFADGARLATGAGDGTVRVWDVASGTEVLQLEGTGRTAALTISPNGRWIATGSAGTEALVWNAQTGKQVATLSGHDAPVTALSFADDGRILATGDDLGRCRLWQLADDDASWTESHWLRGHSRSITAMAFVRQGARLVTSSGDNTCGQWDVASGQEITELVLTHPTWVADMSVSRDGERALTTCDDGKLRLWSLPDAQLLRVIDPTDDEVAYTSVDLSADGNFALAASAAKGTAQIWDLATGEEIVTPGESVWMDFGEGAGVLWAARFNPGGDGVLTIGGNDARMWDLDSREMTVRFSPHGAVAAADISPDGKLLVTGSWDQSAKIWDIDTGQALRKLDGLHEGYVNSVEFSPDGRTILTGSDDGTARLWDVISGQPSDLVMRGHSSRVRQARFSADGTRVLTASSDKTAQIWNAATGESMQSLTGHEWGVLCGEFSLDGTRVITGSEDNTALIWDASTGKPLQRLAGHTDSITSVAFSPDGQRAMTASQDNTAKLWDANTGKEILTLLGHDQELTSVSFSPDGSAVLTSGRDGATILWPAVDWRTDPARQAAKAR
ncbi:MAG: protein kinase [Planctomycetota bacterium]